MQRKRLAFVVWFTLLIPSQVFAAFHVMNVKEVYGGSAAAPNARYVMLQMWALGQTFVGGHVLSFFNAAGTATGTVTFGGNVGNGADQATILIATTEAQALFGVTPDFVMSANVLVPAGGKICFETWDCVAWGNYTGSLSAVGTPFNSGGGIPAGQAMRRRMDIAGSPLILGFGDDTNDSANDFRLAGPYPINNAGQTNPAVIHVADAIGSDTNPGTTISPVKTIGKGLMLLGSVAGARELRVAQGSYSEKVTMVEGISLLGGHQCSVTSCNWSRDSVLDPSIIVNTDFEGVLAPNTITRATSLDGFRVTGQAGTPGVAPGSAAITLNGGTPTLHGNEILAGNTTGGTTLTGQSIGIAIISPANSAQGSLIDGNEITGGSSAQTTAAILFHLGSPSTSAAAEIRGNTITGGTSSASSYGILANASASGTMVKGNDILTGSSTGLSGESWGIAVYKTMTIDSNRINVDQVNVGSCSSSRWCGGILNGGTATITNNVVFGAKASRSAAVLFGEFEAPIGTVILNGNDLDGGGTGLTGTSSSAIVLQTVNCALCGFSGVAGRIRNNVLFGGQNASRYGLYEDAPGGHVIHPEAVENNDFYFAPLSGRTDVFYRSYDGIAVTNYTTLPTTTPWSANFTADPLLDGTFHLMSGSPCVDAGTAVEAPASDFDADLRPQMVAVDVGADEQLPPATSLIVDAPANATGGSPFNVTVTTRTATASVATGYRGTVHFTSDDTGATLPADYTFTAGDSGVHIFTMTLNTVGSRSITVTDTAAPLTGSDVVVVKGNTTTTLTTSGSPSTLGQSVTFTATVTSASAGTISGTVTFKDGATTIATGNAGSPATFSTSSLTAGSHSITADYEGDANFNASTSNTVTQTVNLPPFGPPAGFSATATSATSVQLQWQPVADATGYEVHRATSITGGFILAASSATSPTADGLPVSPNTTYIYEVRALGSSTPSAFSAIDVATTVVFADSDLLGVAIKANHILQLRSAINAMRAAGNLTSPVFTDDSLSGIAVKAVHITELRSALDGARSALGLPAITYADVTITPGVTTVKKDHALQLRSGTQ